MRRGSVQIGPGASSLILILVMLAMSVLGMLTFISARNDMRLGLRSAQVTEAVYALNEEGEETFARLAETLRKAGEAGDSMDLSALEPQLREAAEGTELEISGETISWTQEDALRTLHCSARYQAGEDGGALIWTGHELISRSAEMEDEWDW